MVVARVLCWFLGHWWIDISFNHQYRFCDRCGLEQTWDSKLQVWVKLKS